MLALERLAVYLGQPSLGDLARRHTGGIDVAGVDPQAKLHARRTDGIGKFFHPLREFLQAFAIASKPVRPVVRAWNQRTAFVPTGVVIKNLKANSLCKFQFVPQQLFATSECVPDAVGRQR